MIIDRNAKIYVAGHRGLVGSACVRFLQEKGFTQIITRSRKEVDLLQTSAVEKFYAETKPDYVIDAAARVGGIHANSTYPVEFLYENLQIQNNLIRGAYQHGVKKFLFLGSSCVYPKLAPQPISEESLMTGPLEPTNYSYALAKIAGIRLCQSYHQQYQANFISANPCNLYGPHDNFDPQASHVIPAMLRRFQEATEKNLPSVTMWGTGSARREFMYIDDLAEACLFLLENYDSDEIINVGCGEDVTIKELAEKISVLVGYRGEIIWDTTKPDGMPRKLLNSDKIHKLGWKASTQMEGGLRRTYEWWLAHRT